MHRYLRVFLFLFFITALPVAAQQNFTQYLTRSKAGEGVVILHQDAEIEALVNGTSSHSPVPAVPASRQHEGTPSLSHVTDSLSPATNPSSLEGTSVLGRRMRATGYRIQVYAGGNNRQSKAEAYRMADLVRSTFIDANVYTSFISPRWTCRVGDFKTREEATEMLQRMRETQKFREAAIVKSQIIVVY